MDSAQTSAYGQPDLLKTVADVSQQPAGSLHRCGLYSSWRKQRLLSLQVYLGAQSELDFSEILHQLKLEQLQRQLKANHGVKLCHIIPRQTHVQVLLWLPAESGPKENKESQRIFGEVNIEQLAQLVQQQLAPATQPNPLSYSPRAHCSSPYPPVVHSSEHAEGCISYVLPACFPLNSPAAFLIKVPLAVARVQREQHWKHSATGVYKGAVRILLMSNEVLSDQCEHILSNGTIRTRIPSIGSSCVLTLVILGFNGGILGCAPLLVLPRRAAEEVSSLFACMMAQLSHPLLQLSTVVPETSSVACHDSNRKDAGGTSSSKTCDVMRRRVRRRSSETVSCTSHSASQRVIDADSMVELVVTHAWQRHLQPFLEDFGMILSGPGSCSSTAVQHSCSRHVETRDEYTKIGQDIVSFLVHNYMPSCLETVFPHIDPSMGSSALSAITTKRRIHNHAGSRADQMKISDPSSQLVPSLIELHSSDTSQCTEPSTSQDDVSCKPTKVPCSSAGVDAFEVASTSGYSCDGVTEHQSVGMANFASRFREKHSVYMAVAVQISLFLLLSTLLGTLGQFTRPSPHRPSVLMLISTLFSAVPHVAVLRDWEKYQNQHDVLVCLFRLLAACLRLCSQDGILSSPDSPLLSRLARHALTAVMRRWCFQYKFSAVSCLFALDVLQLPFPPETLLPSRRTTCLCLVLLGLVWLPWLKRPRNKAYACKVT